MRRMSLRARAASEDGAVAVMFAVMLVVLLGFVGAGVDLASAYAKSQEMQNAADAAALGAAQECASASGCTAAGALAQDLAKTNVRLEPDTVTATVSYPALDRVRVVAEGAHQNFFLGLFGQGSFQIAEDATAVWGVPTKGPTTMPLAFSMCSFEKQGGASGAPVVLYLPKKLDGTESCVTASSGVAMPAGFAFIDDQTSTGCSRTVQADGWIASQTGNNPKGCSTSDLKLGETVLVPIFDYCWSDKGVKDCRSGAPAPPGYTASWDRWYHIKTFAAFKLTGYYLGSIEAGSPVPCKGEDRCVAGSFVEYVSLEDAWEYGSGPDYGASVIALVD